MTRPLQFRRGNAIYLCFPPRRQSAEQSGAPKIILKQTLWDYEPKQREKIAAAL